MAAKAFPSMSSLTKSSCSTAVNEPRATSAKAEANLRRPPPPALSRPAALRRKTRPTSKIFRSESEAILSRPFCSCPRAGAPTHRKENPHMVMSGSSAAPSSSGGAGRPGPARRRPGEFGGSRKFTPRRKVCQFCVDKIKEVDYKDLVRLRRFLSERGKIEPRRKTGTCAAHQRSLNVALKRARQLALLPFTAEHIRVTGVLVREPGAPPFRGARPRPPDFA